MALSLKFTSDPEAEQRLKDIEHPIAEAAAEAVQAAAQLAVADGRANIASAGFSSRWQKGLTYRFYPNDGLDPAALIYHTVPYAGVFEKGVTIRGKPLLWLPIEANLPGGINWTPSKYAKRGKKLVSVNVPGKRPLLFDEAKGMPVFFGIKSATIRKRFRILEIIKSAAERMGEFYEVNLKVK